ncbi:pleckstrin homology domain-containing family M member 1 [Pelodytes ibericus]
MAQFHWLLSFKQPVQLCSEYSSKSVVNTCQIGQMNDVNASGTSIYSAKLRLLVLSCNFAVIKVFEMSSPAITENTEDITEVKQRITKKLSSCLKALQIRYVTTDDLVTSDDDDANGLCVALEAIFIHGLKSKFIKTLPSSKSKGRHVSLPQPAFWTLLKGVTHRNVLKELSKAKYITTDVGRSRSWLRLALNDSLMECYFISLQREKSRLAEYYQPYALMMDSEDCVVVLSYMQGLTSLVFDLSYKSSILNEWTATPLCLSGLWLEDAGRVSMSSNTVVRRTSLDSMSESSSSEDTNSSMLQENKVVNESSSMSLDTNSSSSQLSSSVGSDGQPNDSANSAQDQTESPDMSSCSAGTPDSEGSKKSEGVTIGLSPTWDKSYPQPMSTSQEDTSCGKEKLKSQDFIEWSVSVADDLLSPFKSIKLPSGNPAKSTKIPSTTHYTSVTQSTSIEPDCTPVNNPDQDSNSVTGCKYAKGALSCPVAELPKSRSWISEEDFQMPEPVIPADKMVEGSILSSQSAKPNTNNPNNIEQLHKAFKVIHRRQKGLNPFHGLLMMGRLERRNALGLYRSFYCELTPFELRLSLEGENGAERLCLETCMLFSCESVGPAHSDGRFELHFNARKLCLRAHSGDEAQDWVERLQEAVDHIRSQKEEDWEILPHPCSPSNWGNKVSSDGSQSPEHFNWISPFKVEPDALKEAVLYMKTGQSWTRCIFSLSETILRCFLPKDSAKVLHDSYSIEMMRDIIPDPNLGGPSCFRLVTSKGSLQLQAESATEAKTWRELVRAAYLESEEDSAFVPGDGNFQIKSHIRDHPLFKYFLHIPVERGLDTQNFKCAACYKQIGLQFGKAKICSFSGLYYCELCHLDQTALIPSRIVHNWDVKERPVSKAALRFLDIVKKEPLINVQYLNKRLYGHTHVMHEISRQRERLRLLGEYLMTCRSGALQLITKRLDQRCYLLDCAHTYSLHDLYQIIGGAFEVVLQAVLEFSVDHVYECDVCRQKGFICQICNGDEIIYPFQFETTTRCGDCKSVFHIPCKKGRKQCPRCARRKKSMDRCVKM